MESPKPTEILSSTLVSVVRHFLSIAAAYLISKGLVAPEVLSEANIGILAAGGGAALISLGWIVYNKLKHQRELRVAIDAPPGTPIGIVKADASELPLLPK